MRTCTICGDPRIEEINATRGTLREVSAQYGISFSALARHRSKCLVVGAIRAEALEEHRVSRLEHGASQPTSVHDAGKILSAMRDRFLVELSIGEQTGKGISLPVARELRAVLELAIKTSLAQEARGNQDERATMVEFVTRPGCCPRENDERCLSCDMRADGPPAVSAVVPVVEPEVVPVEPAQGPRRPSMGEWMAENLRQAELDDDD